MERHIAGRKLWIDVSKLVVKHGHKVLSYKDFMLENDLRRKKRKLVMNA